MDLEACWREKILLDHDFFEKETVRMDGFELYNRYMAGFIYLTCFQKAMGEGAQYMEFHILFLSDRFL